MLIFILLDADRARKHGLDEYVTADPCKFNHANLFKTLQTLTLDYRLNDAYTCLVSREPVLIIEFLLLKGKHLSRLNVKRVSDGTFSIIHVNVFRKPIYPWEGDSKKSYFF